LNGTIQVLVIDRVLIMPNPSRGVGHFVAEQPKAVVTRIGFDPARGDLARPSQNGRLHSHRATNRGKDEIGGAADMILMVRSVVIHVALPGVSLAPGVFVRGDILRFGKIGRAGV